MQTSHACQVCFCQRGGRRVRVSIIENDQCYLSYFFASLVCGRLLCTLPGKIGWCPPCTRCCEGLLLHRWKVLAAACRVGSLSQLCAPCCCCWGGCIILHTLTGEWHRCVYGAACRLTQQTACARYVKQLLHSRGRLFLVCATAATGCACFA